MEARPARLRSTTPSPAARRRFAPIDPNAVRLYVCGPTVYDFAHIGNARPVDRVRRAVPPAPARLRRRARDLCAQHHRRRRQDQRAGRCASLPDLPFNEAIAKVTRRRPRASSTRTWRRSAALPPTVEPRATGEHRGDARVERAAGRPRHRLCRGGPRPVLARRDGRMPGAPRYGALARRWLGAMLTGARVDVAAYKRDPMDCVLWKPSKPNERAAGRAGIADPGRPGWHIECSAMSMGEAARAVRRRAGSATIPALNTFDIPGGGVDLVFPHHENEIAQSCCAFGGPRMANVWMHNGFLQVEGEKMSKSLGNFVTIRELLRSDGFGGRAWPGEVLRLAMLRTHYRQPIDWTVQALEESREGDAAIRPGSTPSGTSKPGPRPRRDRSVARRPQHTRRGRANSIASRSRGAGVARPHARRRRFSRPRTSGALKRQSERRRTPPPTGGRAPRSRRLLAARAAARGLQKLGGIGPAARRTRRARRRRQGQQERNDLGVQAMSADLASSCPPPPPPPPHPAPTSPPTPRAAPRSSRDPSSSRAGADSATSSAPPGPRAPTTKPASARSSQASSRSSATLEGFVSRLREPRGHGRSSTCSTSIPPPAGRGSARRSSTRSRGWPRRAARRRPPARRAGRLEAAVRPARLLRRTAQPRASRRPVAPPTPR